MKRLYKEILMWILNIIPFIYLVINWNILPEKIATHFSFTGQPNGWTEKSDVPLLIIAMVIGTYFLMLFLPFLDPKRKIANMGNKYVSFRIIMTMLMSAMSIYILHIGISNTINLKILYAILGVFLALQGNYMQALRPNYFLGIRTPWTLENDETWRKTHRLGGKIWMLGGLLMLVLAFTITNIIVLGILVLLIISTLVVVPIVYSFIQFKNIQKNEN